MEDSDLYSIEGRKQKLIDWIEDNSIQSIPIKFSDKLSAMKLLCQISGDFEKEKKEVCDLTILFDKADKKL